MDESHNKIDAYYLYNWLTMHLEEKQVKQLSKLIGYRLGIFSRKQYWHLYQECAVLNTFLVIYMTNSIIKDDNDTHSIIDHFLERTTSGVFKKLEDYNPSFSSLYTERISKYYEISNQNNPMLGWSGEFLCSVFQTHKVLMTFKTIDVAAYIKVNCDDLMNILNVRSELDDETEE